MSESSEEESLEKVVYTGRGRAKSLAAQLKNRELGRRGSNVLKVKVEVPFSDFEITVRKAGSITILNKRVFCGRYSGYLGITHNSKFLITMTTKPEKVCTVFFFSFTPEEANLHRIIVADTPNGCLYLIKAFVPPVGTKFTAVYIHDIAVYNSLTNKENNLPVHIHMSPSKYLLQVNISNLIVVIPRVIPTTSNKKSIKYYLASHEDGFILNTGIAMVNYMFMESNKLHENDSHRNTWKIVRKPYPSFMAEPERSTLSLDLGEAISITGCVECSLKDFRYQYKLVKYEEDISENEEVLSLVFVRDYLPIEDWLNQTVRKYLRSSAMFQGAALRALQDYEVDVSDIEGFTTSIQAFALCELEMYKETQASINEFHLFHILLQWDISRGCLTFTSKPIHIGKIETRFVFANRWWPVKNPGAVMTKDTHQYLSNQHILKGDRICPRLMAYNGSLEYTFDPDYFQCVLRHDEIGF